MKIFNECNLFSVFGFRYSVFGPEPLSLSTSMLQHPLEQAQYHLHLISKLLNVRDVYAE